MNSNSNDVQGGGAPSALRSAAVGSADAVVAEKLSRLAAVLEAIPAEVSVETKAAAEAQMAGYAVQFTPTEITNRPVSARV